MKLSLLSFVQLALLAVGLLQVGANPISELEGDIVDRKDHRVSGQRVIYDNATLEYVMEGHDTASAMESMLRGDEEDMESSLVSKRNFLYGRFGRPRPRNSPRSSNLVIERKIKHPATNTTVIVMRRSAEITRIDQESVSKTLSNNISLTSQLDSEETLIFGPQSVSSSISPTDYVPLLVGGLVLPIWLLWKTKKAKEVSDAAAAENDGLEDIPLDEAKFYDDKKDSGLLRGPARHSSRAEPMDAHAMFQLVVARAPVLVWLERAVYVLIICTSLAHLTLLFFLRHHQNDRSTLAVRTAFTFCFFATLFLFPFCALLYLHAAVLDTSHVAKPIPRDSVSEDSPRKAVNKPRLRSNSRPQEQAPLDPEAAKSPVLQSRWLDGTSKLRLAIVGFLPFLLAGVFSYFFVFNGFTEDKEASLAWLLPATLLSEVNGTSKIKSLIIVLILYTTFVVVMLYFTAGFMKIEKNPNQSPLELRVNGPQIQLSVMRQYAFLISMTLYHFFSLVVLVLALRFTNASPPKLARYNALLKHAFAGISLCLIVCQYMLHFTRPKEKAQKIQCVEKDLMQSTVELQKITASLKTRKRLTESELRTRFCWTLNDALSRLALAKQMIGDQAIDDQAIDEGPWQVERQQLQEKRAETLDEAAELLMRLVIAHLRGCVECVPSIPRKKWRYQYLSVLFRYGIDAASLGCVDASEIIPCAQAKILALWNRQFEFDDWIKTQTQRLDVGVRQLCLSNVSNGDPNIFMNMALTCRRMAMIVYVLNSAIDRSIMPDQRNDDDEDKKILQQVFANVTDKLWTMIEPLCKNDASQQPKETVLEQLLTEYVPLTEKDDNAVFDYLEITPVLEPLINVGTREQAVKCGVHKLREEIRKKAKVLLAGVMKKENKRKRCECCCRNSEPCVFIS